MRRTASFVLAALMALTGCESNPPDHIDLTPPPPRVEGSAGVLGPDGTPPETTTAQAPGDVFAAPTTSAPVRPAGSPAGFGDGQYTVGWYVHPGVYQATVPAHSAQEWRYGCVWVLASDYSNLMSAVIDMGDGQPGDTITVTLSAPETVIKTRGCGEWTRIP